ncbi:MAG TPA: sigma factor-like helix-turn-helix DNA-binding protein, partial [Clostridia bacterium]|nr:sigma factor-like helix-turn-helix DNA-binding protein [Clostridia bacterium]
MSKSEKLFISRYNDFYGCLLTEHQCEMIRLYYDCDISLFEIAEQFGISRQAVRDTIKRAEQLLVGYEQ